MSRNIPIVDADVETDCLIIGAGPAGASLACFLINYGLRVMVISDAPGTTATPRAHLINMAGLECMRDLGLEDECLRLGNRGDALNSIRWCYSITGVEYGRIHAWGAGPAKMGEVADVSPCASLDLPQTYLEPILVRYATTHGVKCLFNTCFAELEQDAQGCVTTAVNKVLGQKFKIRSRYVFGCDGARSPVAAQIGLSYNVQPSGGVAYNILFNADLGDVMKHQTGHLHWIMQPDTDLEHGIAPVLRMVKPWHQWILVVFPKPGVDIKAFGSSQEATNQVNDLIRAVIGDDKIPFEVVDISSWRINETAAKSYSKGNVFCLGDAVHRHPPIFGLGSNTCIQDAYNLAWKAALVLQGKAGEALLDTYNVERQPVGQDLVKWSNELLRNHATVWGAIGMFGETKEERIKANRELSEASAAGRTRRRELFEALERHRGEGDSVGMMMNQWYTSHAVYLADEEGPQLPFPGDYLTQARVSTYPGNRLPHAWLSRDVPSAEVSTLDLAGKSAFSLFTGHGGDGWKAAARRVGDRLGITVHAFAIGFGLDYADKYRDWTKRREVDEDGCVLVRPDRYVAWRAKTVAGGGAEGVTKTEAARWCEEKLERVLRSILSL
ncbi:hypothetical protein Z517_05522 [Fonsecaea pedrosoi CBS 271.37]|uniref:FAD-binding domain-containing protein n=1 Tax=Fonsecaea pedrosoi CBS 271.37 TaxID=1442368 RepID=A0A0D2GV66_9EURO|nr:uncharacterized protein Z517_05522 [Fonsecaea pedrosoi CBS 271.37]KIW82495.1 hypothetical protein Z517_05522 [Fonsecaea pedrosoi CBS 271.37]